MADKTLTTPGTGYSPGKPGLTFPGRPTATAAPSAPAAPAGPSSPGNPAEIGALAYIQQLFPWISSLNLAGRIQQWVVEGLTPEAIVGEVRNTAEWKQRFSAIRRPDGTLRMNEAQYIDTETSYRKLMKQFGRGASEYDDPSDYVRLFENEIDPNEFRERLDVYDKISKSSRDVKEAFYIYAGMHLTDDQLYQAATDPQQAQALTQTYNITLARQPVDYPTYIQRVAEVGLQRAADTVDAQRAAGYGDPPSASTLQRIDPTFAASMVDALHAGSPSLMTPSDLVAAFEASLIGGAAIYNGLEPVTRERLDQFREAGVQRARALQVYGELAAKRGQWKGMLERSGLSRFDDQALFENAFFLNQGDAQAQLDRAQAGEKALGEASSGAQFGQGRQGQVRQQGLRPLYS